MADQYGWMDEGDYRRARDERERRESDDARGHGRGQEQRGQPYGGGRRSRLDDAEADYGAGWYGEDAARRGYSPPGPYGQPGPGARQRGGYGAGYSDDDRSDDDRGFYAEGGYRQQRSWRRREDDARAGQHRGRGPSDYTRSDERIHEDVNDRLTDDGWLDASDIRVKVQNGEVTLGGLVGRRDDKRRAEAIAESVYGVKHVQNNLRLRDSSMAKPGDDAFKESKADFGERSTRSN
ncbi:MAG: hypothetical protein JWO72_1087 [Caulobacteraceae bacterium]|nr:hypothetical protein [Caulobacteraceae bacterium]